MAGSSAGNKDGAVQVHPWASYGLLLALVGGSLGILATSPNIEDEVNKSPEIQAVRTYFERNPEVELSGRAGQWIGHDHVQAVRAKYEQRRASGSIATLSPRMKAKSQKKFDGLQRKAFGSLESLPAWRFGVVKGKSPFVNTFTHLATHETVLAIGISVVFLAVAVLSLEVAWGSLLFAGFAFLLPFLSSISYSAASGDHPAPWIGPSAAIAALLGAYAVRGIQGFVIPSWVLVPVWVFCEHVLVRDLNADSLDTTPMIVQGVSFAFGAGIAGLIWVTNLEDLLALRSRDTPDLIANPVLEQALEARTHGDSDLAFGLLEDELKRMPGNHDVAIALWETVSGSDRASRAVPALLASIRDGLRNGRREDAMGLWLAMSAELGVPKTDGNLLVRLGEALLVDEEHEPALAAFATAVEGTKPLSPVLALRVARSARDLDHALASRAAEIALRDDQLGESERAELEAVRSTAPPAPVAPAPAAREAPAAKEAPAAAEVATPESAVRSTPVEGSTPVEQEPDPLQDPHAISANAFEELPDGEYLAAEEEPAAPSEYGVVDLSSELSDDEPDADFNWDGLADDEEDVTETSAPEVDTSVVLDEAPSDVSETTETTETIEPAPLADATAPDLGIEEELASRRTLLARAAVPIELRVDALILDIEGRKTEIPYDRIEAVASAAVNGLADKTVLLVDLVLNWMALPDEPLKVLRIRSDAFDPRRMVPDHASALASLRALLAELLTRSGGTPLPDRDAALGKPFATFPDLESYNRDVLLVADSRD